MKIESKVIVVKDQFSWPEMWTMAKRSLFRFAARERIAHMLRDANQKRGVAVRVTIEAVPFVKSHHTEESMQGGVVEDGE